MPLKYSLKLIISILVISNFVIIPNISGQSFEAGLFDNLNYRFIGPDGNRAISIAGVPGDPNINYIGAASGGLWKTSNAGLSWTSIFDEQSASSVSALAIAPSEPDQVWAGTGETFIIRPAHAMGDGIYKSTDAGKTWTKMGLETTGRIGRIVIHPTNPDIVYAAALGHTYGSQQDRGVYRTKDGGKTWEKVLFVDEGTGAADVAINPQNPDILYAGMWSIHINTWGLTSGGPGGGIYRSMDGGDTWEPLTKKGLPGGEARPVGKNAVALCYEQPNVVYALFEIESPALYRSDDNGESWTLVSRNHTMAERAPYYTRIAVSPDNPDELYFLGVRFSKSIDGGKTLVKRPPRMGGDTHDMWIDPTDANRMMVAHDGCAHITLDRGKATQNVKLPIAQMYHVAVDDQIPYNVYGNRQDGYSYRGPSNSRSRGIPLELWQAVGGCESGFAQPDPWDNNIVWSGCYDGGLERFDLRTGYARDVRVWPEAGYGWAPAELKYRWHWNFPMSFSPHVPHRVYVGSQYVHKSDDGGQSWQTISPDLTLNLKSHQQSSGGVATDNLMTYDGSVLFAIEESPSEPGLIWVGSNDGQVNITMDYGQNWENVTKNIPDLPEWGTIACIEPSPHKKGAAFIAVDMHQMGDFDPYIYYTEDYGKSWTKISDGIPKSVHSFMHVIKEDPKMPGLLFAGTDNSVYVSPDYGKSWVPLRNNMPPAPVYWLDIQEHFDDLVVATYGRGFYILDNLTPIREAAQVKADKEAHLFSLRPAYRFNSKEYIHTAGQDLAFGRNPDYGATIDYYLADSSDAEIAFTVVDMDGNIVRQLKGKNQAGLHRMNWDLRYDRPLQPKLRTVPEGKNWVANEFNEDGWRILYTWDLDLNAGNKSGPKVTPGLYKINMKVGNQEQSQYVEVLKDPDSEGTIEDIREQTEFALQLYNAINLTVTMINESEWVRKELQDQMDDLKPKARAEAQALLDQLNDLAGRLYDTNLTGAREDAFRNPMKLYGRLSAVASDINGSGIDFPPTSQQVAVYEVLKERLDKAKADYDQGMAELRELNKKYKLEIGKKAVKP
jgi:photosystem II stability/assembly factor-like uncharacterized protein